MTNGSSTILAESAIAICAVTAPIDAVAEPLSRNPWMIGSAIAADDDAIRTAYTAEFPV